MFSVFFDIVDQCKPGMASLEMQREEGKFDNDDLPIFFSMRLDSKVRGTRLRLTDGIVIGSLDDQVFDLHFKKFTTAVAVMRDGLIVHSQYARCCTIVHTHGVRVRFENKAIVGFGLFQGVGGESGRASVGEEGGKEV